MTSDQDLYNELAYYTLSHPDPSFLHQNIVDAYTAQHATEHTKPIAVVFALIGLYLYLEKNFTGKQVQRIHMQLGTPRRKWPQLTPPRERGAITVSAVMAASPGKERDEMIRNWCASVWEAWQASHDQIRGLAKEEAGIR
jgi:Family of unknown function (DUF5946)